MRIPHNERLSSDNPEAPERRCILSGDHGSRDGLLRLAISPDGDVLPDVLARAPGRGAWIGVTRAELEDAISSVKFCSSPEPELFPKNVIDPYTRFSNLRGTQTYDSGRSSSETRSLIRREIPL